MKSEIDKYLECPRTLSRPVRESYKRLFPMRGGLTDEQLKQLATGTRLRIFVTFQRMAAGLVKLRLYHEVSVSDAKSRVLEYFNCLPRTRILRDAAVA